MSTYENAINTVIGLLIQHNVPFTVHSIWDGLQLRFPWCDGDVACHKGTYGANHGMVETYELPWDDGDVTMLTPEAAAYRLIAAHKGENNWEGDE